MRQKKLLLFLFATVFQTTLSFPFTEEQPKKSCGYQSCHPVKDGFINVHLVPHTHDDVGWLKTVDQYYYGSKTMVQKAGVQYILDSVTDSLRKDPNRRFIYVETAFFWKWWTKQHDSVKHRIQKYVRDGQLEFIGGAWSMNDEATTHYQSTIDQFSWGLRKLNETFGDCGRPKIGWQIDPFGHSREMASIFAQLGFDALLLGRIDYQDKSNRFKTKTPETVWRASESLGEAAEIFTGVMYNTYSPPPGFCFDILCADDPIIDDEDSPDYNVDKKLNEFLEYVKNATKRYTTNNVIITMGGDFTYMDAETWYSNLDKLISYANKRQENGSLYNLIYSTPSCYIKAVHDSAEKNNQLWTVKKDDFFPYSSDPNAFWTGYFTSRPTIKRFERVGNNYLQVCKQLYALADLGPEDQVDLNALREAMGIMQHHDAVSGTEKENVAHDYARLLSKGLAECDIITSTALNKITQSKSDFQSCLLTNISSCPITENSKKFVVTVYNPLSRPVSHYVRFPVLGYSYKVTGPDSEVLPVDLVPIAKSILSTPGRKSEATTDLVFKADNIPPLGFKSYIVETIKGNDVLKELQENILEIGDIKITLNDTNGYITSITMNNVSLPFTQQFSYYEGYVGNNEIFLNRSSGAYIFRPLKQTPIKITDTINTTIYRGKILTEIHQVFNEWTTQIVRSYNQENYVEFEWLVGPIPKEGSHGKEVISRYRTNIKSKSTFYTDSNGREMLKRVRNYRPTWKLELAEPVAGNYYPITSKIVLKDEENNIEMAVLNDRSQGGSSLEDGELELMVHRTCLHDDAFGVGEALIEEAYNTTLVARGSHYLIFGNINNSKGESLAAIERDLQQRKILSAWTFFSTETDTKMLKFQGLKRNLPKNVQILTLEPWIADSLLLRLEHVLEKGEDQTLSEAAIVDLKDLFSSFTITSIRETTLGANQWLSDNNRLKFKTNENSSQQKRFAVIENTEDMLITLHPMQIRTFIINIRQNN